MPSAIFIRVFHAIEYPKGERETREILNKNCFLLSFLCPLKRKETSWALSKELFMVPFIGEGLNICMNNLRLGTILNDSVLDWFPEPFVLAFFSLENRPRQIERRGLSFLNVADEWTHEIYSRLFKIHKNPLYDLLQWTLSVSLVSKDRKGTVILERQKLISPHFFHHICSLQSDKSEYL